jgi:serine-aspartate repeat-containing protein C/D/E
VVGDWDGDGKTDIGIFGPAWTGDARAIVLEPGLPDSENELTGRYKNVPPTTHEATIGERAMRRTAQGDLRTDLIDHVFQYGNEGDVPVAGDWNGDGVSSIGLFRAGTWFLDVDGNGRWSAADVYIEQLGRPGDLPVVGDFNGDGIDDPGVYRDGIWRLDSDGDHKLSAHDKIFELGTADDKPVVGDFNADGIDEIAIYRDQVAQPDQQALRPTDTTTGDATLR